MTAVPFVLEYAAASPVPSGLSVPELISPTAVAEAPIPTHPDTPLKHGDRLTKGDWLFLAIIVAAQAIWVWRHTLDYWYDDDFWAMLGDGNLTLRDTVDEHGGHWTAYHRIAANIFYDTSGMSYWPVAGVFSAVSWGAFALWSAWATNRLGASRLVSICVGVLIGMGIGVVFKPWLIGKVIGHVSWVTASILISGPKNNTRRGLLFLTLVIGVSSGFQTVCFLVAATLYCTVRRSVRYWLPACLGALAVYVAWRRTFGATTLGKVELTLSSLAEFPFHMFDVATSAISRYLGISFTTAAVLTAVIGFYALYRHFAGLASHHEALAGLAILMFTAATVYSRVLPGVSPASATRYTFPIVVFLLLGFAPALRFRLPTSNKPLAAAALLLLVVPMLWVLSTQRDTREAGFRFEHARHAATQDHISAAAFLLAEGIPFEPTTRIRPRGAGGGSLTVGRLADLVDDGLVLTPTSDNIAEIQAAITIKVEGQVAPRSESRCGSLVGRADVTSEVLEITGAAGRSVEIGWTDLVGGAGSHRFPFDTNGKLALRFIAVDEATYWLDTLGGEYEWCQ